MQLRRSHLLASVAVVVLGCDPSTAPSGAISEHVQPVTNGADDDSDPAVVAIVFAGDPPTLRCTGTVISERVVLTAAHCDVQYDPAGFELFFGADLTAGGSLVSILDVRAHPDFDDTASHDLALLLLAQPAPAPAVPPLGEPLLGEPPPVALRLVGFGDTGPAAADGGRKREGSTRTTEVTETFVTLGADPSLPCSGDSGGPALLTTESGEALAAVVSRGDAGCASYGKATRVDSHLDSFIQPYLAETAPGAVSLGEPCLYPEQCASGLCVAAVDEPLLRFCSQGCTSDDCPDPLICEGGECRYGLPSPGAVGAACSDADDCLRGECLDDGWCSVRCVSGRGDCPADYECTHLGGIDFYCMPAPSGCCATTRSSRSGPGSGGLLVASLLLLLRVRRRR